MGYVLSKRKEKVYLRIKTFEALQDIVRTAYKDVFEQLDGNKYSHEDIYNHFITVNQLGPEMSAKTTRFFVQLCQLAEIDIGINGKCKSAAITRAGSNGHNKKDSRQMFQMQAYGPGIFR